MERNLRKKPSTRAEFTIVKKRLQQGSSGFAPPNMFLNVCRQKDKSLVGVQLVSFYFTGFDEYSWRVCRHLNSKQRLFVLHVPFHTAPVCYRSTAIIYSSEHWDMLSSECHIGRAGVQYSCNWNTWSSFILVCLLGLEMKYQGLPAGLTMLPRSVNKR